MDYGYHFDNDSFGSNFHLSPPKSFLFKPCYSTLSTVSTFKKTSSPLVPRDMTSTVGDYLFWRLASLGVQRVIGHDRSSLFIGSIQRNHLSYIDSTHSHISPYSNEVGAFVVSSTPGDLSSCYEEGRRLFAWRPVVFIGELDSAWFTSVADVTAGLTFASATIINSPTTATSQINRVLDAMLYESKPVYIGISLAIAGQVMSIPQTPTSSASYATPAVYPTSGQYGGSADSAVAMSFIR